MIGLMYAFHPDFHTPDDSVVVWHYFSLAKFIGLLESSSLYFSRQDQFDDKGEGHLSLFDKNFLDQYSGMVSEHMESDKVGCYYANCWTMSEADEYVLWNTYASLSDGVVIRSTVGRIKDALGREDERRVYISDIQYFDEVTGSTFVASGGKVNLLALGFSKRKYFSAEKELRLLYHDNDAKLNQNFPSGLLFKVDLHLLIESVYVAPGAYLWFKDAVKHVLELYGLGSINVLKSAI